MDQIEDVKDKPTRAQIETALIEGSKPDAEIDEEDEIPDKTSPTTKKRKASESNEGSKSVKKSRGDGSSNSDSSTVSSSLEKDTQGDFSVEDKKTSLKTTPAKAASSSSAPKGSGRSRGGRASGSGRGGPKPLDTSGVKPHIRPEVYNALIKKQWQQNKRLDIARREKEWDLRLRWDMVGHYVCVCVCTRKCQHYYWLFTLKYANGTFEKYPQK